MVFMPCYDHSKIDYMIHVDDIYMIRQHDNKKEILKIMTREGEYLHHFRGSLETAKKFFGQFGFCALNSGAVVNLKALVAYDKDDNMAYFPGKISVAVSRPHKSKVSHLPSISD